MALDEPEPEAEEVEYVGMKIEVGGVGNVPSGSVTKEIVSLGEGVGRPRMAHLCTLKYIAYFYDHTIFDSSDDKTIEFYLGNIAWPEGLWRGI
jgi:hypothetical protein